MSTNFPTSLDSYTTKVDGSDTILAAHINNVQDAIVAIETLLKAGSGIGTWSPAVLIGATNITVTVANCRYTYIAGRVFVQGGVTFNRGANTGILKITNLPATAIAGGGLPVSIDGIAYPANYHSAIMDTAGNLYFAGSGGLVNASDTNVSTGNKTIYMNFHYAV
ncbi:MAG TPA: hypothetical protein PL187_03960 [Caldilinea sp.]|nr:hypothetical protein [Caldilinea sp.]